MKKNKDVESNLNFSDRISAHVKAKVTKKEPDSMTSLCGDPVKTDKNGNEYFIIPEHQAKYISEIFPKYTVSKGYLPPDALSRLNAESESNESAILGDRIETEDEEKEETNLPEGTVIPRVLPVEKAKPRGNPNWRKGYKAQTETPDTVEPEHQLTEA